MSRADTALKAGPDELRSDPAALLPHTKHSQQLRGESAISDGEEKEQTADELLLHLHEPQHVTFIQV